MRPLQLLPILAICSLAACSRAPDSSKTPSANIENGKTLTQADWSPEEAFPTGIPNGVVFHLIGDPSGSSGGDEPSLLRLGVNDLIVEVPISPGDTRSDIAQRIKLEFEKKDMPVLIQRQGEFLFIQSKGQAAVQSVLTFSMDESLGVGAETYP